MIRFLPHIIFIIAILVFVGAFKGSESIPRLQVLKNNYLDQEHKTQELAKLVSELKTSVSDLENNARATERAARNARAMARPDEVIFLFNENKK